MTTPDRRRSTDVLANRVPRLAEPCGACLTPPAGIVPPRESVAMEADRKPCRRGWRTRRSEGLPSRVGFRPRVGFLEQRTLLSGLPTLTALIASTAAAGQGQSVTFTATVSDLTAGGATPSWGDGHLQRPERNARQRDPVQRRGDAHHREPGGGHLHRHGLLRRHCGLRPQHHGHDRDRRRQRYPRLQRRQRTRHRRRAERPRGVAVDAAGDLFIADLATT